MAAIRKATAVWDHALLKGHGTVKGDSGAANALPVTWAARTEQPGGMTSPEELLAAAHASCYAMAFSGALGRAQHPPEVTVTAAATFDKVNDASKVGDDLRTSTSRARFPTDAAKFEELAKAARRRAA